MTEPNKETPPGGGAAPDSAAEIARLKAENERLVAEKKASDERFKTLDSKIDALIPKREEPKKEAEPDPYLEPLKAADALFERKLAPYVQTVVSNEESRQLEEVAKLEHATDYMDEIKQVYQMVPPESRMRAGAAKAAYDYVMGRHLADIRKKDAEKSSRAPEFTESVGSGSTKPKASAALSDQEKRAAAAYGMSEEEYRLWQTDPEKAAAEARKKSA
jgi:hypothetical protein